LLGCKTMQNPFFSTNATLRGSIAHVPSQGLLGAAVIGRA
jgi:hypothetical protein